MNVANLSLCKELYELSGWNRTEYLWASPPLAPNDWRAVHKEYLHRINEQLPFETPYNSTFAYDLGYLLRKLPTPLYDEGIAYQLQLINTGEGFMAQYWHSDEEVLGYEVADTPEDAAAKLCIELFKQGILERAA